MVNYYLTKEARIYTRIKTVYSINGMEENVKTYAKYETRPLLTPYTRIYSKLYKYLNVRLKTLKTPRRKYS